MATTSLYLDTRGMAQDRPCPLKVAIRHKNSSSMIGLDNIRLLRTQWDGRSVTGRPDKDTLNVVIAKRKADIDAALLSVSLSNDLRGMTPVQLREAIQAIVYPDQEHSTPRRSRNLFVPFYERFTARRNAPGTRDLYNQTLKKIREYDPGADRLVFPDITKDWLEGFDEHLKKTTSPNIRNRHFRNIRAVFNDAIASDVATASPFRSFKMPKLQATRHRALTIDQLRQLRDYPCMEWQREYVDMFMLSFYLIGINMVDLLHAKKEDVRDGRLEYRRAKTGGLYSVKIEPEAQAIIDRYPGKDYLLCPMDRYANHKNYILRMDKALKKVGLQYVTSTRKVGRPILPEVSSYWARHTWTTVASNIDIPMEIIGRALGHSWVTKTITSIYIDFDSRKVDDANRKVLNFVGRLRD